MQISLLFWRYYYDDDGEELHYNVCDIGIKAKNGKIQIRDQQNDFVPNWANFSLITFTNLIKKYKMILFLFFFVGLKEDC